MQDTQKLITYEMRLRRRNIRNKIVLGIFLFIAVSTLLMRITVGALLDGGLVEGKFHVGFWSDPEKAFHTEFAAYTSSHAGATWQDFLADNKDVAAIIARHPSTIWFMTQFTWLTTIIIIMYVTFRFFRFDDTIPRWLRWIMTQKTLSLVAMYDTVVGVLFWASMFKGFSEQFSGTLFAPELTITILVHTVIPVFILTYSVIFLIKDKRASQLNEMFAIKGLIYPAIYMAYYVVLTIVWYDPYPLTTMHAKLVAYQVTGGSPDWAHWAIQLYLIPAALLGIYVILGIMTLFHNIILHKFNKKYDPEKDYAVIQRKEHKLEKISRRLIRQEARNWRNLND